MAFNGLQFLVKEEPRDSDLNDQNAVNIGIKVKEEGDYLPDNPDLVELGNATDGFNAQEWREGCYNSGLNNTHSSIPFGSTGEVKFNAQEWTNRCLNNLSNNVHNTLLNPSTSGTYSNSFLSKFTVC